MIAGLVDNTALDSVKLSELTTLLDFKKKKNGGFARFAKAGFGYRDDRIFIAKWDVPLNIRWIHQLERNSELNSIAIELTPSEKWFVSILCDLKILPLPNFQHEVGLQMGITNKKPRSNPNLPENSPSRVYPVSRRL